jgi:hypothetical protein
MEGLVVGRIVYFVADQFTSEDIAKRRDGAAERGVGAGGNVVRPGDIVPAMVVQVWSDVCVNLKLMLDGPDTYWATSVTYAEDHGQRTWHWMYSGQATRGNAK